MLVTSGSGPRDQAEAWCICFLWQLEQQTTLYTQGQNELDARTREYEAAKQALAEHHTNHENAARRAATPSMDGFYIQLQSVANSGAASGIAPEHCSFLDIGERFGEGEEYDRGVWQKFAGRECVVFCGQAMPVSRSSRLFLCSKGGMLSH